MAYTIFTPPQITPATVVRTIYGQGDITVDNPEQVVLPTGTTVAYTGPNYSRFSAITSERTILLNDPAGMATSAQIFAAFPQIKEPKAEEIRREGGERLKLLAAPYQDEERESWATQQREARAWLLDNTAATPMLSAMATTRGITLAVMVNKVMENVAIFEQAAGQILGRQQALLDQVYAATDYDTMLAIRWQP